MLVAVCLAVTALTDDASTGRLHRLPETHAAAAAAPPPAPATRPTPAPPAPSPTPTPTSTPSPVETTETVAARPAPAPQANDDDDDDNGSAGSDGDADDNSDGNSDGGSYAPSGRPYYQVPVRRVVPMWPGYRMGGGYGAPGLYGLTPYGGRLQARFGFGFGPGGR